MPDPATDWKWPDFDEPELTDRLLLDGESFHQLWVRIARQMPARDYSPEAFETGTGYPWPRPEGSFVLDQGEDRLLNDLDMSSRQALLEEFTGEESGRTPMLAIGSNASPEGLWRKFAHFEEAGNRTVLAVTGRLEDFDVGASAELALYGALPATIFPSPGTRVNTTAVWLTDAQLKQLAWAEIPYWLGRLDTRFEAEDGVAELGFGGFDRALVFVNRFGAFAPHGEPVALAAIAAENRRVRALEQVELLQLAADLAYGEGMTAVDLVRLAYEEPDRVGPLVAEAMRSNSIPFESERWTPLPG